MIESTLHGTLTGTIWWPQAKCQKHVKANLTDLRSRYVGGSAGTFRHAIVSLVNDGDFQSASLTGDSVVVVTSTRRTAAGVVVRRQREIPITRFKSIKDCVKPQTMTRY